MATSEKEKGSFEEKEVSEKEADEGEKEASDKGDSPASTQSDTKKEANSDNRSVHYTLTKTTFIQCSLFRNCLVTKPRIKFSRFWY